MGHGGVDRREKKLWAAEVGPFRDFGPILVVFGGFRCRATRAHYPKPCLVNNFLMLSAFQDLNSPCCSRDQGLKIHPV